jgi:putative PIN family toxin of toxin-antitoxin system
MKHRIVIDTNVLVAGLRSQRGASFKLLTLIAEDLFELCISVGLFFEYEATVKRSGMIPGLSAAQLDDILDYLASVAVRANIYFLWRPCLPDPRDDVVLETAVDGECDAIVTYNTRDFTGAKRFGLQVLRPAEFLHMVEKQS